MKKILLICALLGNILAFGNMASPLIPGSLVASPFTSQYVDILGEKIYIKLGNNFASAYYTVEYRIKSSENGMQVPLMFYAMDLYKDFKVWYDGKEIPVLSVPKELNMKDSILFSDFDYLFKDSIPGERNKITINEDEGAGFYVLLNDLKYFEVDITEGEHIIKVEYETFCWQDSWGWVNVYTLRYALSPAKYWKSFGTLDITLDASEYKDKFTCNLDSSFVGSLDSIAQWSFKKLPADMIILKHVPDIPPLAQILIDLDPFGMALIFFILLIIAHVFLIFKYRKRTPDKRFSVIVIVGSLIIPLLFLIDYMLSFDIIDAIIGSGASQRHGYIILAIFLYPFIMPPYWIIMWLTDRIYRRKILKR